MAPLSITIIVVLGLVTFGADDFLDFLNAYFIELAIMMFERPYLTPMADIIIGWLEEKVPLLGSTLTNFFNPTDLEEGKERDDPDKLNAEVLKKRYDDPDDSNHSMIFYSSEDSYITQDEEYEQVVMNQ